MKTLFTVALVVAGGYFLLNGVPSRSKSPEELRSKIEYQQSKVHALQGLKQDVQHRLANVKPVGTVESVAACGAKTILTSNGSAQMREQIIALQKDVNVERKILSELRQEYREAKRK